MTDTAIRQATDIIAQARHEALLDLPSAVLTRMRDEAATGRAALAERISRMGTDLADARAEGRWGDMRRTREQILGLHEDLEEVQESLRRLENARQEVLLRERLVTRLGSVRRVRILEGTIVALIVAVMAILWVESAYPLTSGEANALVIADTLICGVFLGEFFWRMRLADSKAWYWRRYWLDFVASLPLAGVLRLGRVARLARAARIARLARAARVLRALRALAFFSRGFDKIAAIFRLQVFSRPLAFTAGLLLVGGLVISRAEGDAEGVGNFWEGLWWSFTTVVVGGYGDIHNPVTGLGQIITVLLVIFGIILTGALTAGLASVLLGDDNARIERAQAVTLERIDQMDARMERIEQLLADRQPQPEPPATEAGS